MSHRWLSRAGLAALAPLLAAAPAHAATTVSKSGGELVVTAAAAHANGIAVSLLGTNYVVSDSGDTVAGAAGSGCVQLNVNTVRCPQPGVPRVAVFAGDRDDTITLAGTFGGRYDGGAGADAINAGATPFLSVLSGGPGNDALFGSQGGDILDGGTGADVLDGADGRDRADYITRVAGVTASIDGVANDGEAGEGDDIRPTVEDINGGAGNDTLTGNGDANILRGLGGIDVLNGVDANDVLYGGSDSDTLNGGVGDDHLEGGTGIDTLNGGDGDDRFRADAIADGADVLNGGPGVLDHADYGTRTTALSVDLDNVADDGAAGEGDNARSDVERITGGSASDDLTGNSGANRILGGAGNDDLSGLSGNDRLNGEDGDDDVQGGTGDDFLEGGAGDDNLYGGDGSDGLSGGPGNDFLAGPFDGDGDSLHGEAGFDACGGDHFDSKVGCEE